MSDHRGSADNEPRTSRGADSEPADRDASRSASGTDAPGMDNGSSPGSSPAFREVAASAITGVGQVRTAVPGGKSREKDDM
ncbi:hypothetical protein [Arthrobacter sp. YN]|uniref:hypothetical protein n=1 Tax=Arthrobacter sp. YN TaxID=2020486 RepID=UPI001E4B343F|nr:hypothetical protein [Arthrobacter sp. YN]